MVLVLKILSFLLYKTMPVDKFGRRRSSIVQVHRTVHSAVNKTEDLLLNVASDNNRSMGCIDLTSNKSFTLNLGDTTNKIVYTKDHSMVMVASQGLELFDSNNAPIFKFNVDGQNKMYKDLDCQQKTVTNLPNPVNSTDAVNKEYFVQYIRQHREIRKKESKIPHEPFTDIVLLRYSPHRLPSMISMYVERESGVWMDVTCGQFAENWENFHLCIKDNCFMCYFTEITGGPWTRNFILNYIVFVR
jgi:hypothetical protein